MTDAAFVQVLNAGNKFPVELGGLLFGEPGVAHNIVEEFTAVCVLHNHVELFVCFNNLQIFKGTEITS